MFIELDICMRGEELGRDQLQELAHSIVNAPVTSNITYEECR